MSTTSDVKPAAAECVCANPRALAGLLNDLFEVLALQATELERLTSHVEQHNRPLLKPTKLPECISRLSELHARLNQKPVYSIKA
ncbi:MAG: hypothetical protein JSS27_11255 [Planctomycetes bacterium]|nr:hypothetical protein [Planctomycetota bacterium]